MAKPVICGYLPPLSFRGAEPFLLNIRRWKPKYPLVLFSDGDFGEDVIKIRNPEQAKGAKYADGRINPFALQNVLLLTALRILKDPIAANGYTHMLWIESDCRVLGEGWDEAIVEEALNRKVPPLIAGTVSVYNPANHGMAFTKAWQRFLADNVDNPFPIPAFGGEGAAEKKEPAVFANGALALYNLEWFAGRFDIGAGTAQRAAQVTAFDYHVGRELVRQFGEDAFKYIAHLSCIYSGYGDVMTDELERRQMLLDGRVVGVHQIKSTWTPEVDVAPQRISIGSVADRLKKEEAQALAVDSAEPEQDISAIVTRQDDRVLSVLRTGTPRTDILLVSYAKDAEWARYCVASVRKYAKGFGGLTLVVPEKDLPEFKGIRARIVTFDERPAPYGHLHHLVMKCRADKICPNADFILHIDSDCVFTEPVTPEDYFVEGKPVLLIERFDSLKDKNALWWQEQTERALGFPCPYLTMCRHPSVHPRFLYSTMRNWIATGHNTTFDDYVFAQKPTRLPGFSEFCALGAFALEKGRDHYHWIDITNAPEKRPKDKLKQFWSFETIAYVREELERIVR